MLQLLLHLPLHSPLAPAELPTLTAVAAAAAILAVLASVSLAPAAVQLTQTACFFQTLSSPPLQQHQLPV